MLVIVLYLVYMPSSPDLSNFCHITNENKTNKQKKKKMNKILRRVFAFYENIKMSCIQKIWVKLNNNKKKTFFIVSTRFCILSCKS